MSDAKGTLQTSQGSVRLGPKEITAHGKERSRIASTWFAGIALLMLVAIYGASFFLAHEQQGLLALIGTVFGIYLGRYSQHGD